MDNPNRITRIINLFLLELTYSFGIIVYGYTQGLVLLIKILFLQIHLMVILPFSLWIGKYRIGL